MSARRFKNKLSPHRPRGGFVMVMTLLLLALAATLLAGTACHSMQSASEALQQVDDMQRRWASISARRALLDRAGIIFEKLDKQDAGVPFDQRSDFTVRTKIGKFDCEILVADEDAKLNLNAIFRKANLGKVGLLAERFAFANEDVAVSVRLVPRLDNTKNQSLPAFETWEQVFHSANDEGQVTPAAVKRATRRTTCWGSGRVNIARASDDVLRETCGVASASVIGNRLIQERGRLKEPTLAALLERVQLRPEQRSSLANVLSDRSSCYSAWITTSLPKRAWTEFHVVGTSGGGSPAIVGTPSDTVNRTSPAGSTNLQPIADFIW